MAKVTFFFSAPGDSFPTDNPLLREDPVGVGDPTVPIAPSVTLDIGEGYVIGWHHLPYGPAVAVDISISADSDISDLVIGLVGYTGWVGGVSGPCDPGTFTLEGSVFIRGSGGIYGSYAYDTPALKHSTPALQNGDVVGLKSYQRQYGSGSIAFRGTEYAFNDQGGMSLVILRGGSLGAPVVVEVPPMTPYGGGLPSVSLPPGFPPIRWVGHGIELGSVYANVATQTGHHRRRRIYTEVPRVVSVSWDLTLEQMAMFHSWYENTLAAGLEEFSLQVANQGPGLVWWRARFVEPYTVEANESGQAFWVSAKVLLVEQGAAESPYVPEMSSSIDVGYFGSAKVYAPIDLGVDIVVSMLPSSLLYSAIRIALEGPSVVLREDGYYALREDSSFIIRES